MSEIKAIATPLVAWYEKNKRELPWRENTHPYRVWVSEIMLQQTQVATVIPYFTRFMAELPDIKALAVVNDDKLMKLWEGLGYYSRVRNMKKTANILVRDYGGEFPTTQKELLALPGIGAYTAGAILSIAFGQPVPAVDGNVLRVISRVMAIDKDIAEQTTKNHITAVLEEIYPKDNSGAFTQGLMELGATICLPKVIPKCDFCPIRSACLAYETGRQSELPYKSAKKPRTITEMTVFVLKCGDKIALKRRGNSGLLAGLWELPNVEGELTQAEVERLLADMNITQKPTKGKQKKHIFTHKEWHMTSFVVECDYENEGFVWVDRKSLSSEIALPTAFAGFFEI